MSLFLHLRLRKPQRLMALASAGLLVPLGVAPALAQGIITPSAAMAPRQEREQLAPEVMQAEATKAQATSNQLAFDESVKRLSQTEQSDPAEALTQYKRFFSERALSPALGVQVGLKIAQLRLKLGDQAGALQTCEVIGAKYADEPTVALFALEKARVLLGQKQLAQASEVVNEVMPELVALGPSRYVEISDVLLQLVQTNLDSGEAGGKERARTLCVDLEEVYLRWTKKDAVDHLWQRFEVLQTKYEEVGDKQRAEELLPKVGDALLKMPIEVGYVEGAVLSVETARYFTSQGRPEKSALFYKRVPDFGDKWHTGVALYDQASFLIDGGKYQEAQELLSHSDEQNNSQEVNVLTSSLLASAYYKTGELGIARQQAQISLKSFVELQNPRGSVEELADNAQSIISWSELWNASPILCLPNKVRLQVNSGEPNIVSLKVRTLNDVPLNLAVDNSAIQTRLEEEGEQSQFYFERVAQLRIAPDALLNSSEAIVTVSSPKYPNFVLHVLVHIDRAD